MCACAAVSATVLLDQVTDGASIEGVWQDVKWGDLITVRRDKGEYRIVAVTDSQTAEEFSIRSCAWDGKALSYTYIIPSNKTTVIASVDRLKGEYLMGRWKLDDNTNSGEFTCKKMMTEVAVVARNDELGKKDIGRLLGKVYNVKGNQVVIASGSMHQVKLFDRVYVYINEKKVHLKVLFPMITIAKCALEPAGEQFRGMLVVGMPVYR